MGKALSFTWRGIVDVYNELFPMVGMNLVWVVPTFLLAMLLSAIFIVPFSDLTGLPAESAAMLLFLVILTLLVLGPNPASVGMHNYANQLVKEERVEFALFWEGLRQYWAKALLLFVISIAGFVMLIGNAVFYLTRETQVVRFIGIVFIYGTYIWLSMQIYMIPLLVEQEVKSVKLVIRNAAILAIDNPLVTLVLVVLLLVLSGVSVGLTILIALVTGSLVAVVEHRATLRLLEKYRARGEKSSS